MKIKFIVDSSATSKAEAEKKGYGFVPLYFYINDKEYQSGISMTDQHFYETVDLSMSTRTAAAPVGLFHKEFKKYSKTHDLVIAYLISEKVSAQTKTAIAVAKEFKNVHVVRSKGLGLGILNDIEILKGMNKKGATAEEILEKAEALAKEHFGIIVPKTLDWFVKGGRLPKAAHKFAKLLNICVILKLEEGELRPYGKGRKFLKTIKKAIFKMKQDFPTENKVWTIYHGGNKDLPEIKKMVEEELQEKVNVTYFPAVGGSHTGPGVICVFASAKS